MILYMYNLLCSICINFNLLDSVSKIVSKLTSLVLSSTNVSGLLCIQDLDTAQKMGWFWLVETDGQDASDLQMSGVCFSRTCIEL